MITKTGCRHIMPSGKTCESPAMRGASFCYFHGRPQRPARVRRPVENPFPVALVFDEETAQQAFNEIVQALAANHISNRRAALLIYGTQLAAAKAANNPLPFDFDGPLECEDLLAPAEAQGEHFDH